MRIALYTDLDLVGDALIKLPFLRAVRNAYPRAHVTWIAGRGPTAFAGALAPLTPGLLDRVLEHTGVGAALAGQAGRPDLLLDTQQSLLTVLSLWRVLRPRRTVAMALQWRKPVHLVRRLLHLLERASGQPADPSGRLQLPAAALERSAALLPAGPTYIAQIVGAGGKHKAWPVAHHVALANALRGAGLVPVLILGPDEQGDHASLSDALPFAIFPLQEGPAAGPELTIALGARCDAGVAADCGGGHMLAASGTRLVSLFGPTAPEKFAPWCADLTILRAEGSDMATVPVDAVLAALLSQPCAKS